MTAKNENFNGIIAPIQNVGLFSKLMQRVMERPMGLPGLATFHGASGYGKTFSATYAANKFHAYYIQIGESWTKRHFLEKMTVAIGGQPLTTIPKMAEQIIEILTDIDRPLIIDEFDRAVDKNFVELVREIHDETSAPIVIIGEEGLPKKLQKWERFHNRILDWVPAQPLLLEEMKTLVKYSHLNIEIEDDLLRHVHDYIEGNTRRASTNITLITEKARALGIKKIGMKEWGDTPLFVGKSIARGRR